MNENQKDLLLGVLSTWIASDDKSSELYKFIRGDMDDDKHQLFSPKDQQLFLDWLVKEFEVDVEIYEKFYQQDKKEYEAYINSGKERKNLWAKIGNNIKLERLRVGLSLEQLAEKTWYHFNDIAYLESGGEYDKRMVLSLQNAISLHLNKSNFEMDQRAKENSLLH